MIYFSTNKCVASVFDSFIPVTMFGKLRFKSYVLIGIHTLLDKPFRVLQIPIHLSNLTANG